jgi:uncharacterized protein YjbI with pentapeptide repeats
VKLPYTHFSEVDIVDCKLVGVDWTRADWSSFNLRARLKFSLCILNDSSFFGLSLNELKLDKCKLHDVDFRGGDFSNSFMTGCDFTNSLFMQTTVSLSDK